MNKPTLAVEDIVWEEPACVCCGGTNREPVIASSDYEIDIDCTFHVVRCSDCGLGYTFPRPVLRQIIEHFYPDDYICFIHANDQAQEPGRLDALFDERTNGPRLRKISRYFGERRIDLLDVGCGDGYLIKHLKRKTDWRLRGLEPNEVMAAHLRRMGIAVDCGLLEDMRYQDASFDVVTLTHVLEHTENPLSMLIEISRILRPGGMLMVEVPNFNAFDRGYMGRFWWGYHLPRHTYHFTQVTLSRLAAMAGLQQDSIRFPLLFGSMAWNFHILLKKSFVPKFISDKLTYRSPILLGLGVPFEMLNVALKRGNLMEMCFIKPADAPAIRQ